MKILGGWYSLVVIGDGTTSSLSFDLGPQLQADLSVPDVAPDGVHAVAWTTAEASISGTVVTFTWATPLANGGVENPQVQLTFPA